MKKVSFDRSHKSFLFVFHCNYDRILYRFRDGAVFFTIEPDPWPIRILQKKLSCLLIAQARRRTNDLNREAFTA